MPKVTVIYGDEVRSVDVESGSLLGDVIAATGLPLEQPCAGRGICGLCKVLSEEGLAPPDDVEREHLSEGELAIHNRLACRARVQDDTRVVLAPVVVYSNKIFRSSSRYQRSAAPLGLAIDLGSTTVAAFLTMLDDGEVCAGAASLNQQTVYGADVISRVAAAISSPQDAKRLHRLAVASINQAIDALRLSAKSRQRVVRATVVGNVAMHHLLAEYPLETLAALPFQPFRKESIRDASFLMDGILPQEIQVNLPPLIGGFVGSDALACLAYFGFDRPPHPMAAVDLGTNGEVMVTDGRRIVVASTAAGPAFEGVNISCGTRAVDGAIVSVRLEDSLLSLETIAEEPPVGLTGSGLLSAVYELRRAGVIEAAGRIVEHPRVLSSMVDTDSDGIRRIRLSSEPDLWLTQWDVRELQKAKGAIRAASDTLLASVDLHPSDLKQVILTGSFGGQVDIDAALALGMLPPVRSEIVASIPNGAGFGAAMFLSEDGFALGESLASRAQQIDLDLDPQFNLRFTHAMSLTPDGTD